MQVASKPDSQIPVGFIGQVAGKEHLLSQGGAREFGFLCSSREGTVSLSHFSKQNHTEPADTRVWEQEPN